MDSGGSRNSIPNGQLIHDIAEISHPHSGTSTYLQQSSEMA